MSLPHLLLVDDSDAILNFEKAVLSGLYRLSTAGNGVEALEKIRQLKPDGVLLDLSMPEMDGDEVLKIIKADPVLAATPFLVISSEKSRAEACLKAGAEGMINKPILVNELKEKVALMLETVRERERKKSSAFLFLGLARFEMGLPLGSILSVHSQPATRKSRSPSPYRDRAVDYYGETVEVLDLSRVLGVEHDRPPEDRKLVFLQATDKLALCVDQVWNPEELSPEKIHALAQQATAPGETAGSPDMILSMAEGARGGVPILNPEALFSEPLLSTLSGRLSAARGKNPGARGPSQGGVNP
jgi:CheY-like chemotaxis protein